MARSTTSPNPADRDKTRPSISGPSRLHSTATDAIVAGLAPALIIGMICCLVFFLVTITYRGEYSIRLMYILGLYTFSSVLIARIAIEQSRAISMAYTGVLGAATLLVVMRFVQFSGLFAFMALPLVVGFLVLIGFLADRITFDCTLIDDSEDSSGVGLLQSLGVLKNPQTSSDPFSKTPKSSEKKAVESSPTSSKTVRRKARHNPGVWVLYFALFAIPLFGLGQLTIPAYEAESRRAAYWFLFDYLLFSLSLLVSTSFLGLRRYLRQRQVEMPLSMSALWIGAGMAGVLAVLLVVSLLPLPSGSQGLLYLPIRFETVTKLEPNRFGWGKEGTKKDATNASKTVDDKAKDKDAESSAPTNKPSEKKVASKTGSAQTDGKSKDTKQSDKKQQEPPKPDSVLEKSKNPQGSSSSPSRTWSMSLAGGLSNLLRWIVSLILLLVIAYLIVRYRDELKEAWRDFEAWWRGLFGIETEEPQSIEATVSRKPASLSILKSFSDFANPFSSRSADWNAGKIVRHTFEAIEVWGRERKLSRSDQETPEEFLRRLAACYPDQAESLLRLMQLYNRLAYANAPVDSNEVKRLSTLWDWLEKSPT